MKKVKNQITKIYKRKCEEIEILICYRMLLQRISRHLSPEEVSFLMGKPLDFMTSIETFKIKSILAFDLFSMYRVLEVNSMDSMMPFGVELSSQKNLYELHVTTLADRVIYELYKVDVEQNQKVIEFKLIDARHDIDPYTNSTTEEVEKIRIFLNEQIDVGFFNEERQPDEIHNLCCAELKRYIRPKNLMLVLDELLQGSEAKRIVRKEIGYGFGYVLAAHEKSTEKK
ncbi:MAG: hypothetical protein K0S24_3268 [Sphingobacterium sp.]|nr:hypothetical protein [Sphingobacterium sp.]